VLQDYIDIYQYDTVVSKLLLRIRIYLVMLEGFNCITFS